MTPIAQKPGEKKIYIKPKNLNPDVLIKTEQFCTEYNRLPYSPSRTRTIAYYRA